MKKSTKKVNNQNPLKQDPWQSRLDLVDVQVEHHSAETLPLRRVHGPLLQLNTSDIDRLSKPPPTWSNPSPFWYLPTKVFPSASAANPQDMEGEKKSIIYNVLGFPSRMESTLSNPINSCQTGGWIQRYLWSPVIQAKSSHCLPHLHKKRVWSRAWYSKLVIVYIQTHCSGWVPVC